MDLLFKIGQDCGQWWAAKGCYWDLCSFRGAEEWRSSSSSVVERSAHSFFRLNVSRHVPLSMPVALAMPERSIVQHYALLAACTCPSIEETVPTCEQ
eukprot:Skav226081  [mRNA]  locus=scaffold211:1005576:1005866:- [translate_table: standard]